MTPARAGAIDLVVPTIGRPSLAALLTSIAASRGPRPQRIYVVDDRRDPTADLPIGPHDDDFMRRIAVRRGAAAGPAAARNSGWRAADAPWIAFVDDDVLVDEDWLERLADDTSNAAPDVAGSQGRVRVPLPAGRRPTDWERNVAGLATAQWITADCAYRRADLLASGGFDARFPRAYREDADLGLRLQARGKRIIPGSRGVRHPVRPAHWMVSVGLQAGNADDVVMTALHGATWRARAGAPRGAFGDHVATVGAAALAALAFAGRKPLAARIAGGLWALQTGRFAWRRIAPGPRSAVEVAGLLVTSTLIPFAAVFHRVRARLMLPALLADRRRAPRPVSAVLFDRDGTLIVDVPYNADPRRVVPMPTARVALDTLRRAGVATAVVSNQGGVALGRLSRNDVDAINARTVELLGPLGPMLVCVHGPRDRCACRKPAPGLIFAAARALGVAPQHCVVIGDIGADMEAARAAGARAILVATPVTRPEEVAAAPYVAADLDEAVRVVLSGAA